MFRSCTKTCWADFYLISSGLLDMDCLTIEETYGSRSSALDKEPTVVLIKHKIVRQTDQFGDKLNFTKILAPLLVGM